MKRVGRKSAKLLAGLVVAAVYAMPQAYTISARPGAVNYVEGSAYLDGQPLSAKTLRATFLSANDTLSTDAGKVEVLLTPGVFLRIGDNSEIRMISPSLTNIQVEVTRGEAMIEAAGLVKDDNIQVIDHGGSITIEKIGLYRFTGDNPPAAAVLDGKAEVYFGDRKIDLGKGHEAILDERLKSQKFDTKREDDLYAWSNVRSEYDAAATYSAAKNVTITNYGTDWYGYGFGNWYGPGWYWNNGFNTWAWLPGAGGFYSPFGWGFFGPGYWSYAPVIVTPVYSGGGGWSKGRPKGTTATVPVNPKNPPAVGAVATSPFAYQAARSQAAQSFAASGGLRTASGAPVAVGRASSGFSGSAASGHASGGGFSGGGMSHGGGAVSSGGGSHK
ncbi:MAG: hypothetical protein JO145_15615 [Acidobacteriaceae bacterium]|nr:hypothetical protein [Acidobacteriaceae bacterium]MBV9763223.1 hypothetical protein [Acidobacteriaceae bacterium]